MGPDSRYCGSHISVNLGQVLVHHGPNQTPHQLHPKPNKCKHTCDAGAFYIVSFDKSLLLGLAHGTENSSQTHVLTHLIFSSSQTPRLNQVKDTQRTIQVAFDCFCLQKMNLARLGKSSNTKQNIILD